MERLRSHLALIAFAVALPAAATSNEAQLQTLNSELSNAYQGQSVHLQVLMLGGGTVSLGAGVVGTALILDSGNPFSTVVGAMSLLVAATYGAGTYGVISLWSKNRRSIRKFRAMPEQTESERRTKLIEGERQLDDLARTARGFRLVESGLLLIPISVVYLSGGHVEPVQAAIFGAAGLFQLLVPSRAENARDRYRSGYGSKLANIEVQLQPALIQTTPTATNLGLQAAASIRF